MNDPQFMVLIGTLLLIADAAADDSSAPVAMAAFLSALALYVGALVWWVFL